MTVDDRLPAPEASWAYFLDIDGTLIDLAASPESVVIDPGLHDLIARISAFSGGALALVTGRPITDVDRFFPDLRLAVAGQHGLERRSAMGVLFSSPIPARSLDATRQRLAAATLKHPGLLLEDKWHSLALHYRLAPRLAGFAYRLARTELRHLGPGYSLRGGKRVVEIGPAHGDKGEAIQAFLAEPPFAGRRPVFLGDDTTDEAGFRAVNRLMGLTIKVGDGPSVARWRLPDVRAVRSWLAAVPHCGSAPA